MENKQKPSNLYMVPSHSNLDDLGKLKLFKKEMLEWSIFDSYQNEEIIDYQLIKIHRNAFEALTMISPFSATVSMGINLGEELLFMSDKRTWGQIYLHDECILTFSHDTRKGNSPFNSLLEWPELDNGHFYEERKKVKDILFSWDTEKWRNFFIQRIKERAQFLLSKADAKKKDVSKLEESAHEMLFALI